MSNKIISLETAKLAKDKKFNLSSPAWYGCDDPVSGKGNQFFESTWMKFTDLGKEESQKGTLIYSAPTQGQLKDWLRNVHGIHLSVCPCTDMMNFYYYIHRDLKRPYKQDGIPVTREFIHGMKGIFETYEDAMEDGLKECLNVL